MDLGTIFGAGSGTTSLISYSAPQIVFNILAAFILSSFVAFIYQFTHRGYSYSRNFVMSLILISLVVCVIMMVIGNSLARAFALLGSFSIIRFRTAVKDTKDISFVFLSLVLGMATGTNNYLIAVIGTTLILLVVLLLDRFNLIGSERTQYTLSLFIKGDKDTVKWDDFGDYLKYRSLLSVSTRDNGKILEYVYAVDFKKKAPIDEFTKSISNMANVKNVNLFSTKDELEY